MLNGITHRQNRSSLIAAFGSCMLLALVASASAAPGNGRVFVRGSVYVGGGNVACAPAPAPYRPMVVVHGDRCGCDACGIKREYARGFNRGEAAGSNQGFRDGINSKPACADIRDDLCHNSPAYRDGYMTAFGKAYSCAFERGRAERNRACRPVVRPRCPW